MPGYETNSNWCAETTLEAVYSRDGRRFYQSRVEMACYWKEIMGVVILVLVLPVSLSLPLLNSLEHIPG